MIDRLKINWTNNNSGFRSFLGYFKGQGGGDCGSGQRPFSFPGLVSFPAIFWEKGPGNEVGAMSLSGEVIVEVMTNKNSVVRCGYV